MVSTTAVMDTQFTEQFKNFLNGETDAQTKELREKAFAVFAESGFPTPKVEDWKYTNVAQIAKEDWSIAPLSPDFSPTGEKSGQLLNDFNVQRSGFAALNVAFGQFQVIRIPKETVVDEPIELIFSADQNTAIFPHILIIAEAGSKATIVETYSSPGKSFTNTAIQLFVEDNANLTHYRVQKESENAFHEIGRAHV